MKRLTLLSALALALMIATSAKAQEPGFEVITPAGMPAVELAVKYEHKTEHGDFHFFTFKYSDPGVKKMIVAIAYADASGNLADFKRGIRPGILALATVVNKGSFGFSDDKPVGKLYLIVNRVEVESGVFEYPLPESIEETRAIIAGKSDKQAKFTPKDK